MRGAVEPLSGSLRACRSGMEVALGILGVHMRSRLRRSRLCLNQPPIPALPRPIAVASQERRATVRDYAIIFGAAVWEDGRLSPTLRRRVQGALAWAHGHPE